MIVRDEDGYGLRSIIKINEAKAEDKYDITHSLVVVKYYDKEIVGYNNYRNRYEIFGGIKEANENIRDCIERETYEELGIYSTDFKFLGVTESHLGPNSYNENDHIEYGALYELRISIEEYKEIKLSEAEIRDIKFRNEISKDEIAQYDEALIEYSNKIKTDRVHHVFLVLAPLAVISTVIIVITRFFSGKDVDLELLIYSVITAIVLIIVIIWIIFSPLINTIKIKKQEKKYK